MNVISLAGAGVNLTGSPLFEDVTLGIDSEDRIGFVGPNGSGKSTFLRLLAGEIAPDAGTVSRSRGLTLAALEQRPAFRPGMTIGDVLLESRDRAVHPETEEGAAIAASFRSYCRELGLADPGASLDTLSGGMLRKASLARCLALGAGFLTLDEPTNHLDLDTIEWLESLLRRSSYGFVLVTHDRRFLDAVCSTILEIDGRRIYKYAGNYSAYLERKAERLEISERAEERRRSILRTELEWLKRGPRARTGKDKGRKDRIRDLRDAAPVKADVMEGFSSVHRRLGKKILELNGIAKRYGGKAVVRPFSHTFRKGERVGIIGPNGSGKTTFLRLVSGEIEPDAGTIDRGLHTAFAHFDQTGSGVDGAMSVIEYLKEIGERIPGPGGASLDAKQFLERFLFPRAMQSLALAQLSGGEYRRLTLARLLAAAPNFLLLDEPTNDLDLDTIRLLESYLADFEGCILLVSHDRALLDRLTDSLFVFDGAGGIRPFTGSYDRYRELRAEELARQTPAAAKAAPDRPVRRSEKRRLSFTERQEHDRLLNEIAALETEQRALESSFERAVQDPAGIGRASRRHREIAGLLEEKLARWEELAGRADA